MAAVTDDPVEATRLAARSTAVVLVGKDAAALAHFVVPAAGEGSQGNGRVAGEPERCLVGVLVGELADPEVAAAAAEMAAELWPWAETAPAHRDGGQKGPRQGT
jgi:hypothetical protein